MVKTLFVRNLKTIYKPWIIFSAILTMYITVIIGMFDPALGRREASLYPFSKNSAFAARWIFSKVVPFPFILHTSYITALYNTVIILISKNDFVKSNKK